jgi:hypothetical protein
MRHTLRRAFVFLFALMQCLGPLLHAHVHAGGHGGIHLHFSPAQLHGGEAPVHAHADDGFEMAIGLPLSLQPRLYAHEAMSGPVFPLPAAAAQTGHWPKRPHSAVLPAPPAHLIPLPGAPPTA